MNKPSTLTLRLTAEEAEQLEALKRATGRKTGSEVIKHLMKEFPILKQAYESEKEKCKTLNSQLKQRQEAAETFVGALDQFIKLTKNNNQMSNNEFPTSESQILIYQTPDGNTQLDVTLQGDTVWINRQQMADLFERDIKTVGKHINNALKEELNNLPSVAKIATVQKEGGRQVERQIEYYNLDMVISVGYRVKSSRGIQFRIWANKILKEYIVKGYAVNQQAKLTQLEEAINSIKTLTSIATRSNPNHQQAGDILQVISDYTYALDTLDKYDYQTLQVDNTTKEAPFRATYQNAIEAIGTLSKKFGSGALFANEKDHSFKSSINTIYQTFDGIDLYPSIEEKAAMLLYLVVKNHSFSDGNKRIAAFLFLWFLENNGILYKPDHTKLIENNTLVALTLMIAESRTEEKDTMVKVIVNLINRNN